MLVVLNYWLQYLDKLGIQTTDETKMTGNVLMSVEQKPPSYDGEMSRTIV